MKVAVAQINCELGNNAANVAKIAELTARAASSGAEFILFPEMSDTGYAMPVIRAHAREWNDPDGAVPQLREMARLNRITMVVGVSERENEDIFNAQVFIDASGRVAGGYRKAHLFSPPPLEEHKCFRAGDCLAKFRAGEFHFGASICYDLRFPEVYRALSADHGVTVFLVSSAWPFPRVEHFRTLLLARAIENQCYVLAANRVGTDEGVTFCGSSAVIDPYGVTVAAASADREELLFAEVDRAVLNEVRERMPVLEHRRSEVYRGT